MEAAEKFSTELGTAVVCRSTSVSALQLRYIPCPHFIRASR